MSMRLAVSGGLLVVALALSGCPGETNPDGGQQGTPDGAVGCEECGANQVCDEALGRCVEVGCASTYPCDGGTCVGGGCAECSEDEQCKTATAPFCRGGFCAQCEQDSHCGDGGQQCVGGACRALCDADGGCPTQGLSQCAYWYGDSVCVQCQSSADCETSSACYEGACRAARPADRCSVAVPIDVSSGAAHVVAKLPSNDEWPEIDHDNYSGRTADMYFRFTVSEGTEVSAHAVAREVFPYPQGDVRVELYTGGCEALVRVASAVERVFVPAGTHYLRLYEWDDFSYVADFDLYVETTPSTRAPGNTCFQPIPLMFDGGSASTVGDTLGLRSMHGAACGYLEAGGEETAVGLAYGVHVPFEAQVDFQVTALASHVRAVTTLRDNCFVERSGYECAYPKYDPLVVRNARGPIPPGDYELLVRTTLEGGGPFQLDVQLHPWAQNDTCATAEPLVFTDGRAVVRGNSRYADDIQATCQSARSENGLNYRFSTVGLGDRSIKIVTTAEGFSPEVTLSKVCQGWAPESEIVRCGAYGGPSFDLPKLPEGEYFIQITGSTGGPVELEVTIGPPHDPPAEGDSCDAPVVLDLSDGGTVTVAGDTRGASANQYTCSTGGQLQARDLLYEVRVPRRGVLNLAAAATSPGFDPRLSIRGYTCSTGGTCVNQSDGGTETAVHPLDFYNSPTHVSVSGAPLEPGTFELTASYSPPPDNDACSTSVPSLAIPSTTTGDLRGSYSDDDACFATYGPDLFFQVRPTSNTTLTVTLTPENFRGKLKVLSSCATTGTCVGEVDALSTAPGVLTFSATRNTTYYVLVAGTSNGEAGPFTLQVQ